MDADDVSHCERFALQVAALEREPGLAVVATRVRSFPRAQTRRGMREYLDWSNQVLDPQRIAREILVECPVVHPTVLVRKSALLRVGGYRQGEFPEDYDLWLRMHRRGCRFRKLPEVLLGWRERSERLTRTHPMYAHRNFVELKAEHVAKTLSPGRPVVIVGAGVVGKPLARGLLRRGVSISAFLDLNPRKIGKKIHGIPVLHAAELSQFRGALFLAAVSARLQRDVVRGELLGQGLVEGEDFLCAV
jgi:transposase